MSANQTGRRLAPLAPGLPILGNGLDLYRDALAAFVRCYHEVGPIYRLRGPGRHYTVLAGPKANAFLLRGGLVHDRPRMATVRAITEVEMMTLDREAFRELLSESERTSQEIAAVISERLAALR